MRILFVSNYAPWGKVSRGEMPSQHLFGIHELVDHYEINGDEVRGILKGGVRRFLQSNQFKTST